jgi:hypothetical protein
MEVPSTIIDITDKFQKLFLLSTFSEISLSIEKRTVLLSANYLVRKSVTEYTVATLKTLYQVDAGTRIPQPHGTQVFTSQR